MIKIEKTLETLLSGEDFNNLVFTIGVRKTNK